MNSVHPNDKKNIDLSILLPAYNEQENLEVLLPKICESLAEVQCKYELLVLDTISPLDQTEETCLKWGARYINRQGGNGYGDAIRTGLQEAKGQYIITMDCDGSHSPEFLGNLYQARSDFDIVIASRYVNGGQTDNTFILILFSKIVNMIYSYVLNLPYQDVSNSFRLYHARVLHDIHLRCDNFDIVEEILYKTVKKNPYLKITELPYHFKQRLHGKTKRNLFLFVLTYIFTLVKLRFS